MVTGASSLQRLGRILAERDVVAEVVAGADLLAADALDPRDVLGGAPAFVILDRQLDLVLAQHRLGDLHRALMTLEAGLERFETVELLVPPLP